MKFKVFEKLYKAYKTFKPENVELTINKDGVDIYKKGGFGYVYIQEPENNEDFYVANFLAKIETCLDLMQGRCEDRKEFDEMVNKRIDNYIKAFNAYKEIGKASLVREVLNG